MGGVPGIRFISAPVPALWKGTGAAQLRLRELVGEPLFSAGDGVGATCLLCPVPGGWADAAGRWHLFRQERHVGHRALRGDPSGEAVPGAGDLSNHAAGAAEAPRAGNRGPPGSGWPYSRITHGAPSPFYPSTALFSCSLICIWLFLLDAIPLAVWRQHWGDPHARPLCPSVGLSA